jgi:hypothetical protein
MHGLGGLPDLGGSTAENLAAVVVVAAVHDVRWPRTSSLERGGQSVNGGRLVVPVRRAGWRRPARAARACTNALVKCVVPIMTAPIAAGAISAWRSTSMSAVWMPEPTSAVVAS